MSGSIHTTYSKDIFGLTKREIEEQFNDPNSDLASLAKKSGIKAKVKKERKDKSIELKHINNENKYKHERKEFLDNLSESIGNLAGD